MNQQDKIKQAFSIDSLHFDVPSFAASTIGPELFASPLLDTSTSKHNKSNLIK
jgi:hypothetical protein